MSDHLLALGLFVFSIDTLAFNELQRRTSYRHGKTERQGARAASQYLGQGDEAITLSGKLVPEIAGHSSHIDTLRDMAATGDHWPLVTGAGEVLGSFRIVQVDDRWQHIIAGGLPRAIDFGIDLERAD